MYKCKYCGKEFDSYTQLGGHVIWCKSNPNAIKNKDSLYEHNLKIKSGEINIWNKGLTKDTDERVKRQGDTCRSRYVNGEIKSWCDGLSKDTDDRIKKYSSKISKTISNKIENNDWHCQSRQRIEYKDSIFDSTWEYEFVKFLDNHNIKWVRNVYSFIYVFENSNHKYFPDLYLPDYDLYIEIKGRVTEKDIAKWEQFEKKLDIYFLKDLKKLDIEYFKTMGDSRFNEGLLKYSYKHLNLVNI